MKPTTHETKTPQESRSVVSPLSWLKALSESLERTQCRKSGQSISIEEGFDQLIREWIRVRREGKRVWWIGNGGSAALCSHLSQDMLNKLTIKSQTLNDSSLITCMANDFGYTNVYARPLSILMDEGDLLMAISSSGQSKNILECVNLAAEKNIHVVGISGFSATNALHNSNTFLSFYLPNTLYGITEVGHEAIVHAAIETLWMREKAEASPDLKPHGRDQ
jgi:D-sedoheptulose 7-phosphate isomerase